MFTRRNLLSSVALLPLLAACNGAIVPPGPSPVPDPAPNSLLDYIQTIAAGLKRALTLGGWVGVSPEMQARVAGYIDQISALAASLATGADGKVIVQNVIDIVESILTLLGDKVPAGLSLALNAVVALLPTIEALVGLFSKPRLRITRRQLATPMSPEAAMLILRGIGR